jgi:hypothetical protein
MGVEAAATDYIAARWWKLNRSTSGEHGPCEQDRGSDPSAQFGIEASWPDFFGLNR